MRPNHSRPKHIKSAFGMFLAITLLTGTTPNENCHVYECSATGVWENYVIVADVGPLHFSVNTHSYHHPVGSDDDGYGWGTSTGSGSINIQGRYLALEDGTDSTPSTTTLTMSAWIPVDDSLCEEDHDTGDATDTGENSDTGENAGAEEDPDTGTDSPGAEEGSDTGENAGAEEGSDSGSETMDDTGAMAKVPVPFSAYRIDGVCHGWHVLSSIAFEEVAPLDTKTFNLGVEPDIGWDDSTTFQLALSGQGSAAVDISVYSETSETGECWTNETLKCNDPAPPRDADKEEYYSGEGWACNPNKWTFNEVENPTP